MKFQQFGVYLLMARAARACSQPCAPVPILK